jgi:MFS family permease
MVIGGPLSGWIMQNINGHLNFGGWQWMIFLEALPAVILGVVVLIFMVDRPEKARWLSAEEKELVIGQLAVEGARKKSRIGEALRDPRVWLMVGIIFTCNTGFYGLSFWLPSILKNSGVQDPFVIGLLFALPYGCGAVVALLNARHANAVREYRWHAVVPAVIAGFALIAAALTAKSVPVSMTFIVIAACGQLSTSTVIWSFPARILSQSAAAVGIGLINSLGSLSGISGAMVFSYALSLTNNVNVGTSVIGCSLLICAVLIHVITARGRLNPN